MNSYLEMCKRHAFWAALVFLAGIPVTVLGVLTAYHGWHWALQILLCAFGFSMVIFGAITATLAVRDLRRETKRQGNR